MQIRLRARCFRNAQAQVLAVALEVESVVELEVASEGVLVAELVEA